MRFNISRLGDAVPTPNDTAWYDVIGKFQNAVAKFKQNYATLQSINIDAQKYPELSQMQLDLLKAGVSIKSKIQEITGAVDSAWTWLKSTFGFNSVREMGQINGLGIAPLIPIAVVIAAVALMSKWGFDYATFREKLDYAKSLVDKGYTPVQVNEAVKTQGNGGSLIDFSNVSKVAMFGIAGFIGYNVWKNWR